MTDQNIPPPTRARHGRKKVWITIGAALIVAGIIGLALFQPWKIFTRNTVDEQLPVAAQPVSVEETGATALGGPEQGQPAAQAGATPTAPGGTSPVTSVPVAADMTSAAPLQQAVVAPALLASGSFVDGEHQTTGTSSILRLADGSRLLRLEDFSTSDGPDVHVWLTDQPAGGEDWGSYDDGRYLELGELKGTDGNQNYPIDTDADLAGLTSVVIWCDRFNVAFGSAPLSG